MQSGFISKLWVGVVLIAAASAAPGAGKSDFSWPQWRGPDRTDVSKETGLLRLWPQGGPKRLWLYENAGNGYSGPSIANGKYFLLGTRDGNECIIALDANTGKELWLATLGGILENSYGEGPRSTPTVDGERVYGLSGRGDLACVNVADGNVVWKTSMSDLGGRIPGWGYTESVLVDDNKLVCTPGGSRGALAALDKNTGNVLWRSTEFTDGAQYASIIP